MRMMRSRVALTVVLCVTVSAFAPATGAQGAATPAKPYDFNGDGFPELTIGAYRATVGGLPYAGAIGIAPGSKSGADLTRYQRLDRARGLVPGVADKGDGFGASHASGDFNGDGYADLVICSPWQEVPYSRTGVLTFMFGSATGLNRGRDGSPGGCNRVAAGDFNGDGYSELVIAARDRAWQAKGVARFASPSAVQFRSLNGPLGDGPADAPTITHVATGDVNGDGVTDLVAVAEGVETTAGDVRMYLYSGTSDGLFLDTSQSISFAKLASESTRDLAVGDINNDGYADIATGHSEQGTNAAVLGAGYVRVVWGSANGIDTATRALRFNQNTSGVPDKAEAGDEFGYSVAIGDVDGDRYGDLVVGAPFEDFLDRKDAGTVTVVRGSKGGVAFSTARTFSQDTAGMPGGAEPADAFGGQVWVQDFNSDARSEIIAASPGEDGSAVDEGAVHLMRGITTTGAKMFGPRTFGITPLKATFGGEGNAGFRHLRP